MSSLAKSEQPEGPRTLFPRTVHHFEPSCMPTALFPGTVHYCMPTALFPACTRLVPGNALRHIASVLKPVFHLCLECATLTFSHLATVETAFRAEQWRSSGAHSMKIPRENRDKCSRGNKGRQKERLQVPLLVFF